MSWIESKCPSRPRRHGARRLAGGLLLGTVLWGSPQTVEAQPAATVGPPTPFAPAEIWYGGKRQESARPIVAGAQDEAPPPAASRTPPTTFTSKPAPAAPLTAIEPPSEAKPRMHWFEQKYSENEYRRIAQQNRPPQAFGAPLGTPLVAPSRPPAAPAEAQPPGEMPDPRATRPLTAPPPSSRPELPSASLNAPPLTTPMRATQAAPPAPLNVNDDLRATDDGAGGDSLFAALLPLLCFVAGLLSCVVVLLTVFRIASRWQAPATLTPPQAMPYPVLYATQGRQPEQEDHESPRRRRGREKRRTRVHTFAPVYNFVPPSAVAPVEAPRPLTRRATRDSDRPRPPRDLPRESAPSSPSESRKPEAASDNPATVWREPPVAAPAQPAANGLSATATSAPMSSASVAPRAPSSTNPDGLLGLVLDHNVRLREQILQFHGTAAGVT